MTVDPSQADARDVHKLLISSIVPRPIAFVSTVNKEGVRNLSPFSFFNAVCPEPPIVAFSTNYRGGSKKDTLRNIEETGEFVVNIVSEDFAEAMNMTSGDYAPGVDEFVISGLTPIASDVVKPARVAESRVQMECRLIQVVIASEKPMGGCLVLGEVVRMHVSDEILDGFRVDPDKLRAVGRMGGNSYSRTRDRFDLVRPVVQK